MKTIETLLKRLDVKFTKIYLSKLYNDNPYRNTLLGISNILSEYGIKHITFKVKDAEEVKTIDFPFMVNLEGKIVLVDRLVGEKVSCLLEDQRINLPFDHFMNVWDKIALVAKASQDSEEPDYDEHRRIYLFNVLRKYGFIPVALLLLIAGLSINNTYHSMGLIFLLVLNIMGIYIAWLLLQNQERIPNRHADEICLMLKKTNCDGVLTSSAAKIMGVIGWSEIGLSYFISNTLITVFNPHFIPYLALINIAGLPYSFWSVWYQKYKVKQWCTLCLIVQVLLWMVFLVNLIFAYIIIPPFALLDIVLIGCVYIIVLLIASTLSAKLNRGKYTEYLEKEIRHLKLKPEVFKALLRQQLHREVDFSTSGILWGNKDANLIVTIVTNPHCYHCSKMHRRVVQLLAKTNNRICVQYIFHTSREEYETSSIFLISVYLSEEISRIEKKEIYDKWFEEGRNSKVEFFKKYNLNTDPKIVQAELQSHKQWEGLKDIDGTPKAFINGYKFPHQYQIEDIVNFLDLKI